MARLVSLGLIALLIAILGLTFFQIVAPFVLPLFLAATTALLCQPVLRYFRRRLPSRPSLAVFLTSASVVTAVTLPLLIVIVLGSMQAMTWAWTDGSDKLDRARSSLGNVARSQDEHSIETRLFEMVDRTLGDQPGLIDREFFGIQSDPDANEAAPADRESLRTARRRKFDVKWQASREQILSQTRTLAERTLAFLGGQGTSALAGTTQLTLNLLSAGVGMLIALMVFGLGLHYFLLEGPELLLAAQKMIPVDPRHQQRLVQQFEQSMRAVVMATFLAALGQGLTTAITLKLVGFGPFFILLVIATIGALIPMAGTWLVWGPCAAWLAWNGAWGAAIFLTVIGIGLVGMLDNVIRTWVLKNDTQLHPLLAFVSVMGGLQVMGLWGVFIGPIVGCCLHSLVSIFNEELASMSAAATAADVATKAAAAGPTAEAASPSSAP